MRPYVNGHRWKRIYKRGAIILNSDGLEVYTWRCRRCHITVSSRKRPRKNVKVPNCNDQMVQNIMEI